MFQIISSVIGGVGVFLLGMILMTDGLKAIAGDRLKRLLKKFTGNVFSAVSSGAVVTALIQSSSATTLMTIGFVSAGLITFVQAIGVIIGANLGTTATGWLVSLLGFKLKISLLALPLIGIGVYFKLIGNGKKAFFGSVLAGFGLIFVGIDILKDGMGDLAHSIDLSSFETGLVGNLILVVIGIVMTVLMQSSSAAIAITMTALFSNAIILEQAMVLVIGQNIGTTITAIVGAVGGSLSAKRAALAHSMFNILTGVMALILLPAFLYLLVDYMNMTDDATILATFHTLFNILGAALILPFIKPFSQLVMRLIPEKETQITWHLDKATAQYTPVAIEAARKTIINITRHLARGLKQQLENEKDAQELDKVINEAESAIQKVQVYISNMQGQSSAAIKYEAYLSMLHGLDHLTRLVKASKQNIPFSKLLNKNELKAMKAKLLEAINEIETSEDELLGNTVEKLEALSKQIAELRKSLREDILDATARGSLNPDDSLNQIRTILWIDRVGYHMWRNVYHLEDKKENQSDLEQENDEHHIDGEM